MPNMGKISMERDGDDAQFKCTQCGSAEQVTDYENGQKPKKFEWQIWRESEHAKCLVCGESYDNNIGLRFR